MKVFARNIRISPKKLQVIAVIVRQLEIQKSMDVLRFMPKKGAALMLKIIKSAVANAQVTQDLKPSELVIDQLQVTKGMVYKRGGFVGRGRFHPNLKQNSNVLLTLKKK